MEDFDDESEDDDAMKNGKAFPGIRSTTLAALAAGGLFVLAGCTAEQKSETAPAAGGEKAADAGGEKSCGEKSCGEKGCGAEKEGGEKSCGEKSCGGK